MPLSFRQAQGAFIAGPNITLYPSGNSIAISGSASGGGISGTYVSGLTSAGTGNILLLSSITNNNLVHRSISAGTGIGIVQQANGTIVFSATPQSIGTYISGLTSAGTGNILLLSSITNNNLIYKSISAGTGIGITDVAGTITISGSGGSGTITSGTSLGGGSNVFSGVSGANLVFRSLSGASGMETAESGNLVLVRPASRTANQIYVGNAGATSMIQSPIIQLDHTNSTIGINAAASTSTRLLLPVQTTGISPIRFSTSTTDISSPVDGDVWYLGRDLKFRKNTINTDFIFKDNNNSLSANTSSSRIMEVSSGGTLTATRLLQSFGVFNALSSVTISSTTSELSCISTQLVGSTTLQASTGNTPALVTGKKYRFTANGNITTKGNPAGTLTARMKLGSSVIASISGFSIHPNITSPNNFFIEASFTIRNASSGGTVVGFGMLQTDHPNLLNNQQAIVGLNNLGQITVDCTTDKVFDFTFQWSTADASNIITINEATLEYLN